MRTAVIAVNVAVVVLVTSLSTGCGGEIRLTSATNSSGAQDVDGGTSGAVATADNVPACKVDTDCNTAAPHCDASLQRCVACIDSSNCDSLSKCEPTTRRCVPSCEGGKTCPASAPTCDRGRNLCLPCTDSTGCTAGDQPVCDLAGGRCVECLLDSQCSDREHSRCDVISGRCVGCLSSADCAKTEGGTCNLRELQCDD